MNKKILVSLSLIAAVSIIAVGATIAQYTDTQKSAGNTFAMGEFLLTIDSDCHFNGMYCVCDPSWTYCYWDGVTTSENKCTCKWDAKSLTDEKFFDFENLKPGDSGEVTISMHVEGDDYYVRSMVDGVENKDNGCNHPEKALDDVTCGNWDGGELGANLDFAFWADMGTNWGYDCPAGEPKCAADPEEGDNILNTDLEYLSFVATGGVVSGNDIAGDWTYVMIDATNHLKFLDDSTYYMGTAWCVGDLSVSLVPDSVTGVYAITCDGGSVTSIVQTDSYSSDMTFQVVAASNNDPTNPFGI